MAAGSKLRKNNATRRTTRLRAPDSDDAAGRKKDPATMTAEEELGSLLQCAEQVRLENVAAALHRVLAKMHVP